MGIHAEKVKGSPAGTRGSHRGTGRLREAGGDRQGAGWPVPRAVFGLSAGPNGQIETAFDEAADGFTAGGDDMVARVK